MKVNEHVIKASFLVVDVSTQCPLFGRDWMSLLWFDVSALIQEATQVLNTSVGDSTADHLCSKYADVFKEDLGVLRGIEATALTQMLPLNFTITDQCPLQSMTKWKKR